VSSSHVSLVGGEVKIGLAQVGFNLGQQGIDLGKILVRCPVLDVRI
jgi:hypothetical protein